MRRRIYFKRLRFPFLALFIFFISFLYLVEESLTDTIYAFAEAQARWTATEVINKAITEKIVPSISYTDLIKPERNTEQEIVFMQVNMIKVNKITAEAILEIQKSLEKLQKVKFKVPLGQVFGIKIFANSGPEFNLTLLPVGTIEAKIADDFQEAGINQTRHRVYLVVKSTVKVIIPLVSKAVSIETRVPIADAIIVGRVPNTYLNIGRSLNGDILNNGFQQR
ncbi:sporulation protein YunB [Zhaonella formicivorans]|uniref:sporulation protein YunB n=1 Tax=Zhaonella formicivorans TaxID=2528593 RepID=UPI001D107B4F|nr:sporulation protein YunB [Zhaonella formicivorans]